jgi:hypothetical protein
MWNIWGKKSNIQITILLYNLLRFFCYIMLSLILLFPRVFYFLINLVDVLQGSLYSSPMSIAFKFALLPPWHYSAFRNAFKGIFIYATLVQHKSFVKCISNLLYLNPSSFFILNIEARGFTLDLIEYLIFFVIFNLFS